MQEMLERAKQKISEWSSRSKGYASMAGGRVMSAKEAACRFTKDSIAKLTPRERLAIILAIGIILGAGMKSIAVEYVTIGYGDYKTSPKNAYDMIALQKKVAEAGGSGLGSGSVPATGGSCQ